MAIASSLTGGGQPYLQLFKEKVPHRLFKQRNVLENCRAIWWRLYSDYISPALQKNSPKGAY